MSMYEAKEWVQRLLNGGFRPDEIVCYMNVQFGFDEFQLEDLTIIARKLHEEMTR